MDDLDPPREEPGAADSILGALQCHGLHWDESVMYQSARSDAYDRALAQLGSDKRLFTCDCTRAMLGAGGSCVGNCRARQDGITGARALRIAVPADTNIRFNDALQGPQLSPLGRELTDFIVHRKDGLYAYQLAVVVDDAAQGITHVVRGSDLLDSTARQIFLQQCLGNTTPHYCHLPVITNNEGQKFSKQNQAPTLHNEEAELNLRRALHFLHQGEPPTALTGVNELLSWATAHWAPQQVPEKMAIPAHSLGLAP